MPIQRYGGLFWITFGLLGLAVLLFPIPSSITQPEERLYRIQASSFDYSPAVIRAEPGDQVTIELVSTDVVHGLYIDGYDHSIQADPGQPKTLTFTADKAGSFRIRCSVSCGPLHPFMIAKLQVGSNPNLWRGVGLLILGPLAAFVYYRYESYRTDPQHIN
jgi:heme/copper-type cytochrome/quinol oxidase subunit 2